MDTYDYKRIPLPRDTEECNKILNSMWDEGWIKLEQWEYDGNRVLHVFRRLKALRDRYEQ